MNTQTIESIAAEVKLIIEKNRDSLPAEDIRILEDVLDLLEQLNACDQLPPAELQHRTTELVLKLLRFFHAFDGLDQFLG